MNAARTTASVIETFVPVEFASAKQNKIRILKKTRSKLSEFHHYICTQRLETNSCQFTPQNDRNTMHPEVRCRPLVFMLEVERVHIEGVHDMRGVFEPRNETRV